MDKHAFRTLNYGLYIVSSADAQGKYYGCVANTFQQVASEPPMVSVALNKENCTTECISSSKKFCVSVLSEAATMELIGKFGFHSSKELDKFDDTPFEVCESGVPVVVQSTAAVFDVDVVDTIEAGTHIMFVGQVRDAKVVSDEKPMSYAYYHSVLRGKTPPKASSYEGDSGDASSPSETSPSSDSPEASSPSGKTGWRCTLCGYIVEMDELPDDFKCPICGVGKEFFERIDL